jgi:hypothetical protein
MPAAFAGAPARAIPTTAARSVRRIMAQEPIASPNGTQLLPSNFCSRICLMG